MAIVAETMLAIRYVDNPMTRVTLSDKFVRLIALADQIKC